MTHYPFFCRSRSALTRIRSLVLEVQSAFVDVLLAKENVAFNNLSVFEGIVEINTARVRAGDLPDNLLFGLRTDGQGGP